MKHLKLLTVSLIAVLLVGAAILIHNHQDKPATVHTAKKPSVSSSKATAVAPPAGVTAVTADPANPYWVIPPASAVPKQPLPGTFSGAGTTILQQKGDVTLYQLTCHYTVGPIDNHQVVSVDKGQFSTSVRMPIWDKFCTG